MPWEHKHRWLVDIECRCTLAESQSVQNDARLYKSSCVVLAGYSSLTLVCVHVFIPCRPYVFVNIFVSLFSLPSLFLRSSLPLYLHTLKKSNGPVASIWFDIWVTWIRVKECRFFQANSPQISIFSRQIPPKFWFFPGKFIKLIKNSIFLAKISEWLF